MKVSIVTKYKKQTDAWEIGFIRVGEDTGKSNQQYAELILARLKDNKGKWESGQIEVFVGEKTVIIGLDPEENGPVLSEKIRRRIAEAAGKLRGLNVGAFFINLKGWPQASAAAAAVIEALELGEYAFTEFSSGLKEKRRKSAITRVEILVDSKELLSARQTVKRAQVLMEGVTAARDLVNQPANRMSPRHLVNFARNLAKENPSIKVQVWDKARIKREKMGALLAVAQGSAEPPYVIRLTYKPKSPKQKLAIVGKGVTFDSRGLSLKPAEFMNGMKMDMAGAAAVLGLFQVLGKIGGGIEVDGYIATCENMPSGNAYRPGDIIKSRSGKTIEVKNTDAEGRLTMADMIDVARDNNPDYVVTVATLTGACMVALGETVAGLMSNHEKLAISVKTASSASGEQVAELPLPEEYRPYMDSTVADISNIASSRYGGVLTAGLFLQEFVGDKAWAHVDIAGPAYMERPGILPYYTEGATGFGVRLLYQLVNVI